MLNGTAAILLMTGYTFIRRGNVNAHRKTMMTAFCVSCVFLVSYLVYHYNVGSVKFDKPGWVRIMYLWILGTHTVLGCDGPGAGDYYAERGHLRGIM